MCGGGLRLPAQRRLCALMFTLGETKPTAVGASKELANASTAHMEDRHALEGVISLKSREGRPMLKQGLSQAEDAGAAATASWRGGERNMDI